MHQRLVKLQIQFGSLRFILVLTHRTHQFHQARILTLFRSQLRRFDFHSQTELRDVLFTALLGKQQRRNPLNKRFDLKGCDAGLFFGPNPHNA